jgi:hypothetical protein
MMAARNDPSITTTAPTKKEQCLLGSVSWELEFRLAMFHLTYITPFRHFEITPAISSHLTQHDVFEDYDYFLFIYILIES